MTDPSYPDALQPQYRMHWYTVERVLGQGGFGITYLARDTNLDQRVAIKEYLPFEVATRRQDATVQPRSDGQRERYRWGLDRFIQEARTLARFDHPNIVRVHSVFEFNGTAYMVMRFEEGENFGALLESRRLLPETELRHILLPILDGLELVHNAGFIHRDIKPDNIHIRSDGSPVLLDFGSARYALGKSRTMTILVAPGYAPFEQYGSSSENQGPWTDIYGLGATFYRAITGAPPLDAITRSKGILGSTREVLVPARTVGSGRYSGRLLAAIDHALEFAEKDRPQTIAEWRRELAGEGCAASPASAGPASAAGPAPGPFPEPPPRPAVPPEAPRAPSRGPAPVAAPAVMSGARSQLVWAIVGAVAGAVAIAIFLLMSTTDQKAKPEFEQMRAELEKERKVLAAERQQEQERKRREAEEAEKKQQAEDARRKQQELDAEKKRQEQEATRKQQELDAEKKRREQEAGRKRREQDAEKIKRALSPVPKPTAQHPVPQPAPAPSEPAPTERAETPPADKTSVKPAPQALLDEAEKAEARGDFSRAREILTPIATRGNTAAQVKLAEMHANGRGVPRSYFQAYIWYSLAVRCGNNAIAAERAKMSGMLQTVEIQQADKTVASMKIC